MTNPSLLPKMAYDGLEEAFPNAEPGTIPYGSRVLVQIRTPKKQTAGGIFIPEESRETELWNTQVAKVIGLGPLAFKNRDTCEPWPEGDWCQVGEYVRVPKHGGDRWQVRLPDSARSEFALFVIFADVDIIGKITINPLDIVAFI